MIVSGKIILKVKNEAACKNAKASLASCTFMIKLGKELLESCTIEFHDTPFECCEEVLVKTAKTIKFIGCTTNQAITLDTTTAPELRKLILDRSAPGVVIWEANKLLTDFEYKHNKESPKPTDLEQLSGNTGLLNVRIDGWNGEKATTLAAVLLVDSKKKQDASFTLNHVDGHCLVLSYQQHVRFAFGSSKKSKLATVIASIMDGWKPENRLDLEINIDADDIINDSAELLEEMESFGGSVDGLILLHFGQDLRPIFETDTISRVLPKIKAIIFFLEANGLASTADSYLAVEMELRRQNLPKSIKVIGFIDAHAPGDIKDTIIAGFPKNAVGFEVGNKEGNKEYLMWLIRFTGFENVILTTYTTCKDKLGKLRDSVTKYVEQGSIMKTKNNKMIFAP